MELSSALRKIRIQELFSRVNIPSSRACLQQQSDLTSQMACVFVLACGQEVAQLYLRIIEQSVALF